VLGYRIGHRTLQRCILLLRIWRTCAPALSLPAAAACGRQTCHVQCSCTYVVESISVTSVELHSQSLASLQQAPTPRKIVT
jgi:hypothetical protein